MLQLDIDATDFVSFRVPRINPPLWVGVTPGEATNPPRFVVARQRQTYIYANICVLRKSHQFSGSLHKSLVDLLPNLPNCHRHFGLEFGIISAVLTVDEITLGVEA